MHPVLFEIAGFTVPTYGIFIALGVFLAMGMLAKIVREMNLPVIASDAVVLVVLAGLIGGRVFYIFLNTGDFINNPGTYVFSRAGFVFFGGLIGGLIAGYYYGRKRNIPYLTLLDSGAAPLALAHAVGRIGCFMYGCCYGAGASGFWEKLSVTYPTGAPACSLTNTAGEICGPVIATQLIEAAFLFLLSALIFMFRKKLWSNHGRMFGIYVFSYGVFRYYHEFIRDDFRGELLFGVMTMTQLVAVIAAIAGIVLMARRNASR